MSHIADQIGTPAESAISQGAGSAPPRWFTLVVASAMLIHSFVAYSQRPVKIGIGIELLIGAINFAAVVFLFYGISKLAYAGRNVMLWVAAGSAVVVALINCRSGMEMSVIAGWSTILTASILCGVLAMKRSSLSRIYIYALIPIIVFSSIQLYPAWSQISAVAPQTAQEFSQEMEKRFAVAGYSKDQMTESLEKVKQLYIIFVRVLPSLSVLAIMLQFTIGLWLFARWAFRQGNSNLRLAPFVLWKMPFALTPILITSVIMRLVGSDVFTLVADNLLLVLAIFYAISGMALIEFYMHKYRFGVLAKLLVYLLLFLSQVFGFASIAVLGFVDSFFDWRRKYPLPLNIESS